MASTVLPNGIIIPEKYSRDWYADLYHNWQELDNLLGVSPGDGTLTIQKNGSTVGTFSANQATDETINLSVPTKTSDLTNDSGFITADNTKIPLSGTNALAGSIVPSTDNSYDFGSSSYKLRYVYADTAYVTNLNINGTAAGDILTHNANEFVDVTTAQIIGGLKTFRTNGCKFYKQVVINHDLLYSKDNPPSPSAYHNLMFTDASGWWGGYIENVTDTSGNSTLRFYVRNTNENQSSVVFRSGIDNSYSMIPINNNVWDLGTSTNKWKSFNGINPGALSLPSGSYINVDTTNWDLTCQNELLGSFTPTADGWLMLHIANSGSNEVAFWIIGGVIRINNKSSINTIDNNNFNMFTIPVEKDVTYNIYGNASEYVAGRSIRYCRFMPCRGNI